MRQALLPIRHRSAAGAQPPRLSVGIVLAHNFTLSAFALFIDHLRLAADEGDRSRPLHVRWAVMNGAMSPVRSSCGLVVNPTSRFQDPAGFDYVVVVGGLLHSGEQIDQETAEYLLQSARQGITLVGLCTGSFILSRLGLMQRRRCCVSWYHHQDFMEEFPGHELAADRLFVADGDRITCAGGAGTADLAAFLIERHLGHALAQKANQILLFDRARAGGDAQPHPPMGETASNPRIARALILMEQNLARPLTISALATQLGLSTRQFERLSQATVALSPAQLYRTVRLRFAEWLLSHTSRSITDIALESGFADCAHFSRQFKSHYGMAPSVRRKGARPDQTELASHRIFSPSDGA